MSGQCQPVPEKSEKPTQRTVLIVEDEVILRMAVSAHLREAGFIVIEAVNADEAVDVLQANHEIKLVFSDINMPGALDGDDLADLVNERYPELCLLLASGVGQRGSRPFLAKPYSFIALQRRIEELLGD